MMTELVANFERGQLNAQDPLNENFKIQNLINQSLKEYINEIKINSIAVDFTAES